MTSTSNPHIPPPLTKGGIEGGCNDHGNSAHPTHTLIVGLGNILLKDEGVGVRVIEKIDEKGGLPDNVRTIEGGTAGYKLLDWMDGIERLIIIDAVKGGKTPGTVYRLSYDEIEKQPDLKLSGHQIDLPEVLALARKLGKLPDTVLIGVEPKDMDYGLDLSDEVEAAMGKVIDTLLCELDR